MTATALNRLLKHPHPAVFDKTPHAELALRLRHPDGASWRVADGVLTASAAGEDWDYELAGHTVGSLASALDGDGFNVVYLSPQFANRGALVLAEGVGDESITNGDHITAFTSPLWAIMGAYAGEVRGAEYQMHQALRQMVITQAEGEWLDLWGALYAEGRAEGESDADYAPRIPEEAFRIRVNGLAIEQAIKDRTGCDIEIREPWRLMFTLNESKLSGTHALHNADYYTYHVIHPVARASTDWSAVLPVIHRNRSAGVLVYAPSIEFPVSHITVQPPVEYLVERASEVVHVIGAWPGGENPLGIMRLSDNEFTLNHRAMIYQLRTYSNAEGLQTEQHIGVPRNIAYASITLSDGVPLGDENAILSRGQMHIEYDPEPVVSDTLALSDYDVTRDIRRVEFVTMDGRGAYLLWPDGVEAELSLVDTYGAYASAYDGLNDWSGAWSSRNWLGWRNVGMSITDTTA